MQGENEEFEPEHVCTFRKWAKSQSAFPKQRFLRHESVLYGSNAPGNARVTERRRRPAGSRQHTVAGAVVAGLAAERS